MKHGKIIASRFAPAWWLPGGNLQTLWSYFFRRRQPLELTRERLELPDGDFVDLCFTAGSEGPLVAVFHGLEGGIDSHYVRPILAAVKRRNWRGVLMHFRGCGGEHNRLARCYHSGETGDIGFFIDYLRKRFPGVPVAALGYSLGGNALLKYLGEADRRGQVDAAVAVSVPYVLAAGAKKLDSGFSRLYQWHLIARLQRKIIDKFRSGDCPIDLGRIRQWNNFFQYDDNVTAPLHGFADADDYYSRSSSRQYLKSIRVPALLIHAKDDPFMTEDVLPSEEELSEFVRLEIAETGGHIGFVGGALPWQPVYWLEKRIIEFLGGLLC